MMKIKCPACGFDENEAKVRFCVRCGADLRASQEAISSKGEPAFRVPEPPTAIKPEPRPPAVPEPPTAIKPEPEPPTVPEPPTAVKPEPRPPAVPEPPTKAKLVIKQGGRKGHEFPLTQESMDLGRWDADSGAFPKIDLTEDDPGCRVSRKHARIFFKNNRYFIEDLGSMNGTFVNRGSKLKLGSPQELHDGDEIVVGRIFLNFLSG